MNADTRPLLARVRLLIAIVIAGLVVSGVTAFPLVHEVDMLHRWLPGHSIPPAVTLWLATVRQGLHAAAGTYPFLAYGTDWLAFGHLVIALFFIGAFVDPVRNAWIIRAGQIACVLVIPVALICGEFRGIPLWWRAIDCAFGVFGFVPLWLADRIIQGIELSNRVASETDATI